MNSKERIKIIFLICLISSYLSTVQSVANGCGPKITIDYVLKLKGFHDLIICCNIHDNCYETCGKSREECDDAFASCMNTVCRNGFAPGSIQFDLCKIDSEAMDKAVRYFGNFAYVASQFQKCVLKNSAQNNTSSFYVAVYLFSIIFFNILFFP